MKIHIVQKGDTLWKIAKKYGVNFEELKKMNSQLSNPDMIMPGMKIKVPTTGGLIKKEAPIGTKPAAVINAGAKKEKPIAEHPLAKEQPKPLPIEEIPKKEAPLIKEAPKAPYTPKMPMPVIPEIDINNYYMMNMANMTVPQPQPQPPKPENILPEVKEVPKKEVPVIEAPTAVAPIECPPQGVEQPMCPDYCVPVTPVMPGPGFCPPMGYPVQPFMPYPEVPGATIPMTTGNIPPNPVISPAVANPVPMPGHFEDESSSLMPQLAMSAPVTDVMGAQMPVSGQPGQAPFYQQGMTPGGQLPLGYSPEGFAPSAYSGYSAMPSGYPTGTYHGTSESSSMYSTDAYPGYPAAPGGASAGAYPGYPAAPGGTSAGAYPGYPAAPGGTSAGAYPGYPAAPGGTSAGAYPGYPAAPGGTSAGAYPEYPAAPGGTPAGAYPEYPVAPGGAPTGAYPGYPAASGGIPAGAYPGYPAAPGGAPAGAYPGYSAAPGGTPAGAYSGYPATPTGYPSEAYPGYSETLTGYPAGHAITRIQPDHTMPYGYPQMGAFQQPLGVSGFEPEMQMSAQGAPTDTVHGNQIPVSTGGLGDCGCGPTSVPQNYIPSTPPIYMAPYTAPMNVAQPPFMNPYGIGPMGDYPYTMPRDEDDNNGNGF